MSLDKEYMRGTSLVVQWLGICLAVQGTKVRSLVRELRSLGQIPGQGTKIPGAASLQPSPTQPNKYLKKKKTNI